MNIIWLTWKDRFHPEAGGAEVVCHELTRRLVADGHAVTLLTCGYPGAATREKRDGIEYIRVGTNRYLHPFQASFYFARHLRNKFDLIVEEVNAGAPYFSVMIDKRARRFLLYHQLARKNWYFETRTPLNHVGHYILEPVATRLLSLSRVPVITVSESTRMDLARHGFAPHRSHIISEGIQIEPIDDIYAVHKFDRPTLLSLGSMRAMKRTLEQVKAFELAKQKLPDLQMKIAGSSSGTYGKKVLDYIAASPYRADIEYCGKVSSEEKAELMRRCHLITVTSVKEGWGLIVTEAASQGTPAVVYDVDGLRDSVKHRRTGLVTSESPTSLADAIVHLLDNRTLYQKLQSAAHDWSKRITFDQSYKDFLGVLETT